MQRQSKGYIFLILVLGLAALSGWLYTKKSYQYGLDIQGGVRLSYRMMTEELKDSAGKPLKLSPQELIVKQEGLVKILEARVAKALGVVEGNVQAKDTDKVLVELPGYTDAEKARTTLSSTASIKLYHAKTVKTEKATFRKYTEASRDEDPANPEVTFLDNLSRELKPNDPGYKAMIESWGQPILEGTDLSKAAPDIQGTITRPQFFFSDDGATKLKKWSTRYFGQMEKIAFVLDGKVLSIAPVEKDAILSDNAVLNGTYDPRYVASLVGLLNDGALPISLEQLSSETVDPTIGSTAKDQMVKAGIISFVLTALFLLAYYVFPGFVALIALVLYVLFTLTAMKLLGATFSLAAIAGFILSVGMAVDANILVFERAKEEMREGRSLITAVELGFKRALPAIFDSNACTILTSLVLMTLGTSMVKGFASTLIMGVLISLFTAFTVTRSLLVFLVSSGIGNNPKWFALDRQWFGEGLERTADHKPLQIVNTSKKWFMISLITIVPGVIAIALGGIKPNVEFLGGFEATYKVAPDVSAETIRANLDAAGLKGANVKITSIPSTKLASLTIPEASSLKSTDPQAYTKIMEAAKVVTAMDTPTINSVGPSVRGETIRNAVLGVIISSCLIVLYLTIRFGIALGGMKNGIRFGMSAIMALVHDVVLVIGINAILGLVAGWEISALFITSMLTVIGFSVHDTIVIFDRIRENLRKPIKGEDFENLCNRSITQSIARSINTSLTVIVTLIILVVWGTATIDLKSFTLAMLVGIISGTYSSIYNATPILYLWDKAVRRKHGEEAGLIHEATAEVNRLRAAAMAAGTQIASAPGSAANPGAARGYSQVKRRDSAVERSKTELDD